MYLKAMMLNHSNHGDNVTSTDGGLLPGILDDPTFRLLCCATASAGLFLSLLGMSTNAINFRTFLVIGVKDSMSFNFVALSLADFLFSASCLGVFIMETCMAFEHYLGVVLQPYDSRVFIFPFFNLASAFYVTTSFITLFIAATRFVCVVWPLKYRQVFTIRRSVLLLICLNVFVVALFVPAHTVMKVVPLYDPALNGTRYFMTFDGDRKQIKDIVYFTCSVVTPILCEIVVVVCILCMAKYLLKSVRFRKESAAATATDGKLVGKELRAVQQVILIGLAFLVCNIPTAMITIAGIIEPEFDQNILKRRYARIFVVCYLMSRLFMLVNSSVNLFIYLAYNKKFREHCMCLQAKQAPT